MRRIVYSAVLALLLAAPLAAQNAAIEGVIREQMEAFRVDDFDRAFSHASPTIKGLFGTPERFGQMVRQGYPMVHRPGEVRFLDLREDAGRLWQRVLVMDAAGRFHLLDYQMIQTQDGWQINGVELLPSPGIGV